MSITAVAENMEKEFLAFKFKKKDWKLKKKIICTNLRQKVFIIICILKKRKKGKAKISQIKKRLKTFGKLKTKFLHFKIKKF